MKNGMTMANINLHTSSTEKPQREKPSSANAAVAYGSIGHNRIPCPLGWDSCLQLFPFHSTVHHHNKFVYFYSPTKAGDFETNIFLYFKSGCQNYTGKVRRILNSAVNYTRILIKYKYFPKSKKITSIQRQFNIYGFEKLTRDSPDQDAYYHEAFLRGRPELTSRRMVRKRVKGTGHKAE